MSAIDLSQIQTWGSVKNLVPLPYRRVSVQRYAGAMTAEAISQLLLSRDAYRRTDFIVLRGADEETAVVAITRAESEPLFSQITSVEVLALPETCAFVHRPEIDTANRSALAEAAHELGIGAAGTLVVQGLYDHVNFIHHPQPLLVRVVEVAPPEPPKLYGLARQVLSYANLPPIRLELERIEVRDLADTVRPASYLVPCRSGGLRRFTRAGAFSGRASRAWRLDHDRLRTQLAISPPLLWRRATPCRDVSASNRGQADGGYAVEMLPARNAYRAGWRYDDCAVGRRPRHGRSRTAETCRGGRICLSEHGHR